jgi:alanyl-tRNA synthetase
MTDRLYYHDSFLYDFDAEVLEVSESPRPALILDRTAFYPTSGGQVFDTGAISTPNQTLKVTEVADTEDGRIVHYLEAPVGEFHRNDLQPGARIHGAIDPARRRDHMQQHSAQHILSAAFVRLFDMPTVSFHMGDDYCSIDLNTPTLTRQQAEQAERLSNDIILEDRSVAIRFVTREDAVNLGLRKLPPAATPTEGDAPGPAAVAKPGSTKPGSTKPGRGDQLRLIDIHDFDLCACGGTHVNQTGQIGCILVRKIEKVRAGWRVEFVAGQRAVSTARRDFATLSESAALFSAHIYDLPQQARKSFDEIRSLRKQTENLQEQLAEAQAAALLAETSEADGHKLIVRTFSARDMNSLKLLAQKLTRLAPNAIALLASTSPQPALVFAESAGQPFDLGALMKETMARLGGRGGGSREMAQGGVPTPDGLATALSEVASQISTAAKS